MMMRRNRSRSRSQGPWALGLGSWSVLGPWYLVQLRPRTPVSVSDANLDEGPRTMDGRRTKGRTKNKAPRPKDGRRSNLGAAGLAFNAVVRLDGLVATPDPRSLQFDRGREGGGIGDRHRVTQTRAITHWRKAF